VSTKAGGLQFFLDQEPGETEGANLFDPVTSPTSTWDLVDPSRGRIAPGTAQLQLETAPIGGTGADRTVLAATMNNDFSLFPDASFPVYTLSTDSGPRSACQGICAVAWSPVLTSDREPRHQRGRAEQPVGRVQHDPAAAVGLPPSASTLKAPAVSTAGASDVVASPAPPVATC
jgi:hypothetical protein